MKYEMCFPGFRKKALTFSFDDGEDYDRRLAELMRQYNLKATFYLITGQFGMEIPHSRYGTNTVVKRVKADELIDTYRGMELASHTVNHCAPLGELKSAVRDSMDHLQRLCGSQIIGMAYPGGEYTQEHIEELNSLGVIYARTAHMTYSFDLPKQLLAWNPTCNYSDKRVPELIRSFCEPGQDCRLFHIMGHSYELEQPNEMAGWKAFDTICRALSGRDDIWYATNGEIALYLAAARNLYTGRRLLVNESGIDLYVIENGAQKVLKSRDNR